MHILKFLLKDMLREEKGGREREEKKHQCEKEVSVSRLVYAPQLGTQPTTQACILQACALTRNQTHHP